MQRLLYTDDCDLEHEGFEWLKWPIEQKGKCHRCWDFKIEYLLIEFMGMEKFSDQVTWEEECKAKTNVIIYICHC